MPLFSIASFFSGVLSPTFLNRLLVLFVVVPLPVLGSDNFGYSIQDGLSNHKQFYLLFESHLPTFKKSHKTCKTYESYLIFVKFSYHSLIHQILQSYLSPRWSCTSGLCNKPMIRIFPDMFSFLFKKSTMGGKWNQILF